MAYVKNIETNIKQIRNVPLGPLTLLVGANGSGKSSLVDAVLLALTGKPRDAHLPMRSLGLLLPVESGGADPVSVAATLDDEQVVTWEQSGAKANRSTDETLAVVVSDLIDSIFGRSGNGELLKLACQLSTTTVERATLETLVSTGAAEVLRKQLLPDAFKVDALLAAVEALSGQQRATKREATEVDKRRIAASIAVNPLSAEEEQELATLSVARASVLRLKGLSKSEIERRLAPQAPTAGVPDEAVLSTLQVVVAALAKLIGLSEKRGKTTLACPICKTQLQLAESKARHDAMRDMLQDISRNRKDAIGDAEREETRRDAEVAKRFDEKRFAELMRRQEATVSAVASTQASKKLKEEHGAIKEASDLLRRVYESQARAALNDFQCKINEGLPPSWHVQFEVEDNKVQSLVRCGQGRAHVPAQCVSGAERALLSCGLASVVTAPLTAPVKLLLIDDVWLDAEHLADTIIACRYAVDQGHATQAIVCCVSTYGIGFEGQLQDWTVVQTGGDNV